MRRWPNKGVAATFLLTPPGEKDNIIREIVFFREPDMQKSAPSFRHVFQDATAAVFAFRSVPGEAGVVVCPD